MTDTKRADAFARPLALFIMSEGRSGSTWLAYVLGSHTWAATVGEFYIPWSNEQLPLCNLCASRGYPACEVLRGAEDVTADRALEFAFSCIKKPVLIENSKKAQWFSRFASNESFNVCGLHLLRDPRGWYASQKRRYEFDVPTAMNRWISVNDQLAAQCQEKNDKSGLKISAVFYDDLVCNPEPSLSLLCSELGREFELGALCYWEFPHHGPAGNGAFFNMVLKTEDVPITTGDDRFYAAHARTHLYDTRWTEQLTDAEVSAIEGDERVRALLGSYGRSFAHFDRLIAQRTSDGSV